MKKDVRYQLNSTDERYVTFDDCSYDLDYRVDPLTTRDNIREELTRIENAREARKKEAELKAKEQEEAEKQSNVVDERES
jgi:hypothetical protein